MTHAKPRIFSHALAAVFAVACTEVPAPNDAQTGPTPDQSALANPASPAPPEQSNSPPSPVLPAITKSADAPPTPTKGAPAPSPPAEVLEPTSAAAPAPVLPRDEEAILIAAVEPKAETTADQAPTVKTPAPATWEDSYSALLQKYVGSNGVTYKKWHASKTDLAKLNSVTQSIASANLSGKSSKEQLAFYLNAYNAWILQKILEAYPVKGPGNGSAIKRAYFFKSKGITVAGTKMSFSSLENEIIRPRFKEPRIHFALNCASASCPPLHDEPFDAYSLDPTLTRLTRTFVNKNPLGFQLADGGKTARLSEIFNWYRDDFKPAALLYINRFRDQPVPVNIKIEFMDYDWSLNEKS